MILLQDTLWVYDLEVVLGSIPSQALFSFSLLSEPCWSHVQRAEMMPEIVYSCWEPGRLGGGVYLFWKYHTIPLVTCISTTKLELGNAQAKGVRDGKTTRRRGRWFPPMTEIFFWTKVKRCNDSVVQPMAYCYHDFSNCDRLPVRVWLFFILIH